MTNWSARFLQHANRAIPSAIRDLSTFPRAADTIPFGPGEPDASLFPLDSMRGVLRDIFDDVAAARSALQYGASEGDLQLRQRICAHMGARGVQCEPHNIVLTNGAQQALNLISEALVNPGDPVLVQSPTYPGALQVLVAHGASLASIDARPVGVKPSLIYAMANFQNPTGVSLSLEQRKELVSLACDLDTILVEDDPYEVLRFDGEPLPSLLSLDTQDRPIAEARTVYLGTFSKSIAPGLRVGWLAGPQIVVEKLALLQQTEDLQASSLAQAAVARLLAHGIEPFAVRLQTAYRLRRDTMIEALRMEFGNRGTSRVPQGGFFVWVTLPEEIDAAKMLLKAAQIGVTYVPGSAFTHDGTGANTLRLSYSAAPPNRISEGVRRLAQAFDTYRR